MRAATPPTRVPTLAYLRARAEKRFFSRSVGMNLWEPVCYEYKGAYAGRRAMLTRFVIGLSVLLLATSGASAAVWQWGCQDRLGDQQVIFNRESMAIVDTKVKMGDVRKLRMTKMELPPGSPPHVDYEPVDFNGGFEETMTFTRADDSKRKVVLTEKSSKRISHQHKLVCGRDEDIDIYRKVYSLQRDEEPPRDITMQCLEYQLSTRGGRKGCD
jgi:hypothetical protein